ncbi:MAG: SDR family oxidoreductase [Acidobacteriota bacterium]|nr:SDR family oxidoreductase [Acidobacteriota bacterium]
MKILIIGGGGMLGHKLIQVWQKTYDVWTTVRNKFQHYERYKIYKRERTFENVNIQNISLVKETIEQIRPNVVVNAVGVIKQVPLAKNVIATLSINSIFPHQLSELSEEFQFRLINISTDCVFSGEKGNYSESDLADSHDLYGKSKNLGEVVTGNCLTLRTSIIGRELETAHSLVEWFLSNRGKSVKGFVYAIYTGFPTIVLADILSNLIENYPNLCGLYHVSSEPINKYNLLSLINEAYRAEIDIEPFEDFVIDRSLDSNKFREATGFEPTNWKEMIKRMAADNAIYQKNYDVSESK